RDLLRHRFEGVHRLRSAAQEMHEAPVIGADIERVARRIAQDVEKLQLDLAELLVEALFAPVEKPLRADRLQRALDAAPSQVVQKQFAEFCRSKHSSAP